MIVDGGRFPCGNLNKKNRLSNCRSPESGWVPPSCVAFVGLLVGRIGNRGAVDV